MIQDTILKLPDNKPTCLILSRNITELLMRLMGCNDDSAKQELDKNHTCGGCTGLIKFSRPLDGQQQADLIQNILTVEKTTLHLLAKCELFKDVELQVIAELLASANTINVRPETVFIKKGERLEHVYMMLSGAAAVLDQETEIAILKTGQLFGEMSLLCDQPATATIMIKKKSRILAMPAIEFRNLMKRHSSVQEQLTKMLAKRLTESNISRLQDMNYTMRGHLHEIEPVELLQAINMFRLTGALKLKFNLDTARIAFRKGAIITAAYQDLNGKTALFAILSKKKGSYFFDAELSPDEQDAPAIGNFMGLLMEGLKQVDEKQS